MRNYLDPVFLVVQMHHVGLGTSKLDRSFRSTSGLKLLTRDFVYFVSAPKMSFQILDKISNLDIVLKIMKSNLVPHKKKKTRIKNTSIKLLISK